MTDTATPGCCTICGNKLRDYKVWHDWAKRDTHYSCYKKKTKHILYKIALADYCPS